MFEDSTFESTGRIRTRSRDWMIATFFFNGSILIALILIPLINLESLPHQALPFLLTEPPAPTPPEPAPKQPLHPLRGASEIDDGVIIVPTRILPGFRFLKEPEAPSGTPLAMNEDPGLPTGIDVFRGRKPPAVVHADVKGPVRVASSIVAGRLIYKVAPQYPLIAKVAGIGGTVILEATISKSGTIENLRVASGPAMLQQAAIDAVKEWRYRPYLLNNHPVGVETTVNVVFTLGR
jgi:protein TonB